MELAYVPKGMEKRRLQCCPWSERTSMSLAFGDAPDNHRPVLSTRSSFNISDGSQTLQALNLRRLRASDDCAFREIRSEGLRLHPDAFGASFAEEQSQPLERVADRLENGHVMAAVADDVIAGVVGLACSRADKTRHIGLIWGLYVRPSWRRSGVARHLLEAVISDAMLVHPQPWNVRSAVAAHLCRGQQQSGNRPLRSPRLHCMGR
ncbi:hypothetical protein C0V73_11365 [Rhizobium sp. TH135]|nr:hypothetical protein C0V73_11365 [Rhizobium sp. TH135]